MKDYILVKTRHTSEKVLDDILCDICGKSCFRNVDFEYAQLKATWGYDSNKDLEKHSADLCEECYDRVRKFVEELGGKINIKN